jgi:hypothetical protein
MSPVQKSAETSSCWVLMIRHELSVVGSSAWAGETGMVAKDAEINIAPSTIETALRHREAIAIHPETLALA